MFPTRLRYEIRKLAYSRPFWPIMERLIQLRTHGVDTQHSETDKWDQFLSGNLASYLDSTISVVARARLMATAAHHLRPQATSALDIGCGGGQLAEALFERRFQRYLGVDVSRVAIQAAHERMRADQKRFPPDCKFEVGALGSYSPHVTDSNDGFDLIAFSEVLYYLASPRDAVQEMTKCAPWLSSDGLISISLKDDGKSHAIMRLASESFSILHSFVFQESAGSPTFRVRVNRERPAFLIATMTPK